MKRTLINKLPSFRCHNLVIPDRVWNSGYNTPWDVYLSQASHGAVRQTTRVWHDQRKLAKNIGETQRIWRVKIYLRYNYVLRQTLNSSSLLIIDSLVTPNFHWGIIFLAFGYWLYILMCEYLSLLSYVTSSFFLSFFVGLSGDGDLDLRFSPLGKYGREIWSGTFCNFNESLFWTMTWFSVTSVAIIGPIYLFSSLLPGNFFSLRILRTRIWSPCLISVLTKYYSH